MSESKMPRPLATSLSRRSERDRDSLPGAAETAHPRKPGRAGDNLEVSNPLTEAVVHASGDHKCPLIGKGDNRSWSGVA
jgi:hypothetical protein